MTKKHKILLFIFFLVSGFCGLVYQIVWIRLAYASFGVITPVLSVIISMFMLGLASGSWMGGKMITALSAKSAKSALIYYGLCEFLIGSGAFIVPKLFEAGKTFLYILGPSHSISYLGISAVAMSISILPWCFLMGCTFPVMMAYVKELSQTEPDSFSFLYSANVIGAALGAFFSGFVLVELLGFHNTLTLAAILNFLVAATSLALNRVSVPTGRICHSEPVSMVAGEALAKSETLMIHVLLFSTGFIAMSMEVIWTRAFSPALGTRTYSFAALLIVYLLATWAGAAAYRKQAAHGRTIGTEKLLLSLTIFAFLPIVMNDPRESILLAASVVLISIMPFCAALGYLTPSLIDRYSSGNPYQGGKAYGINVLGCIIGPLVAAYWLLPYWGVKFSLVLLATPFIIFFLLFFGKLIFQKNWALASILTACALCILSFAVSTTYEEKYAKIPGAEVRRDYAATVVSMGTGMNRKLVVNGEGAAFLLMENKTQAHLPLLLSTTSPRSVIDICFGVGTVYRSLLSWGIDVTSVELVPSVVNTFGFYFADAAEVLDRPNGHVVVDDGRRFLARNKTKYDVIIVDPPAPVETAGSSLLYSEEFYQLIRSRLNEDGILHQFVANTEAAIVAAATRAILNSFPHVRIYRSYNGWGHHFIASEKPLQRPDLLEAVAKMPESARNDFIEWAQGQSISEVVSRVFANEVSAEELMVDFPKLRLPMIDLSMNIIFSVDYGQYLPRAMSVIDSDNELTSTGRDNRIHDRPTSTTMGSAGD